MIAGVPLTGAAAQPSTPPAGMDLRLGVVGGGRAGPALALALQATGCEVRLAVRDAARAAALAELLAAGTVVASLDPSWAALDAVVVAVQDRAIAEVAAAVVASIGRGPPLLHLSGAHGAALIADAGAAAVGAMHPAAALADPLRPPPASAADARARALRALAGATWAVEGDAAACAVAHRIIARLAGVALALPASARGAWHAAAALVSNDLVGLLEAASALLRSHGVDGADARAAHVHLAGSALQAVADLAGPAAPVTALTGAVARGDVATLARHRAALAGDADADAAHAALSRRLASALVATGRITPATAAAIARACAWPPPGEPRG